AGAVARDMRGPRGGPHETGVVWTTSAPMACCLVCGLRGRVVRAEIDADKPALPSPGGPWAAGSQRGEGRTQIARKQIDGTWVLEAVLVAPPLPHLIQVADGRRSLSTQAAAIAHEPLDRAGQFFHVTEHFGPLRRL